MLHRLALISAAVIFGAAAAADPPPGTQVRFTHLEVFQCVKSGEPVNVTWIGDGTVRQPLSSFRQVHYQLCLPFLELSPRWFLRDDRLLPSSSPLR